MEDFGVPVFTDIRPVGSQRLIEVKAMAAMSPLSLVDLQCENMLKA